MTSLPDLLEAHHHRAKLARARTTGSPTADAEAEGRFLSLDSLRDAWAHEELIEQAAHPHILCSDDPAGLTNLCTAWLREQGYHIYPPGMKEIPSEICRRLGIHINTFASRTRHSGCPPFEADRDSSGRVRWLRSHQALDAWLTAGCRRKPEPESKTTPA